MKTFVVGWLLLLVGVCQAGPPGIVYLENEKAPYVEHYTTTNIIGGVGPYLILLADDNNGGTSGGGLPDSGDVTFYIPNFYDVALLTVTDVGFSGLTYDHDITPEIQGNVDTLTIEFDYPNVIYHSSLGDRWVPIPQNLPEPSGLVAALIGVGGLMLKRRSS